MQQLKINMAINLQTQDLKLDLSKTGTFTLFNMRTYHFTQLCSHPLNGSCSKSSSLALSSRLKVDKIPFKTNLLGFEFLGAT